MGETFLKMIDLNNNAIRAVNSYSVQALLEFR